MVQFTPTAASIPPPDVLLRLKQAPVSTHPPNHHPLVNPFRVHPAPDSDVFTQNPLAFILRAAQIYPEKVALVHTDVPHPVVYTFSIWYGYYYYSVVCL